jgi:hypothetical protein
MKHKKTWCFLVLGRFVVHEIFKRTCIFFISHKFKNSLHNITRLPVMQLCFTGQFLADKHFLIRPVRHSTHHPSFGVGKRQQFLRAAKIMWTTKCLGLQCWVLDWLKLYVSRYLRGVRQDLVSYLFIWGFSNCGSQYIWWSRPTFKGGRQNPKSYFIPTGHPLASDT